MVRKMTRELFEWMCDLAREIIFNEWKLDPFNVELVSGGAAWADHVAVKLFIDSMCQDQSFSGLTIYLPCAMDEKKGMAIDNGSGKWYENPGRTMNQYHLQMQKKTGRNSLQEILITHELGAKLIVGKGFHQRNKFVAQSDYVLAFTFGIGDAVKDGGTKDTWDQAKTVNKRHVSLSLFKSS
jgi:hypothetical protein